MKLFPEAINWLWFFLDRIGIKMNIKIMITALLLLSPGISFSEECPIDVVVVQKSFLIEFKMANNQDISYEIQYDKLPWVATVGGVEFELFHGERKIIIPKPTGMNSEKIRIGPRSSISSDVDIKFLRFFYRGLNPKEISLRWRYDIPGGGMTESCRRRGGDLAVP
ncbi:hypothetical protein [Comamonas serinivorans]|uniref:hypothetical protein n=1 Tax=Comamonas serinivorans TaxID=1082851 RepID=UPI0012F9C992|nr:hypothetical protein [Comamonas serinivorans]